MKFKMESEINSNKGYESILKNGIRKANLLGIICGFGSKLIKKGIDKTQQQLWNYERIMQNQGESVLHTEYVLGLQAKLLKLKTNYMTNIFRNAI